MPASVSEASVFSSQCFATLRSVTMAVRTPGRKRGDARAQRWQHVAADDDVIGALAERDIDGDRIGMFQRRGHGVALMMPDAALAPRRTAARAGPRCIHRRSCRAARRATRSSGRHADRPARVRSISRPTVASGSAVCSSGRSARRFTRRMMISASALSQIDTALSPIRLRVSSRMKAPPPVASTAGPLVEQPRDHPRLAIPEMRLTMGFENVRDRHAGRGLDLGIGVEKRQPQAAPPAAARWWICRRPSCRPARPSAFPAPPDLGLLGCARCRPVWLSQAFRCSIAAAMRALRATYTTPADTVARELLQRTGEHVGSQSASR